MPEIAIPSLHSYAEYIVDRYERAAYLINHFVYNPDGISTRFRKEQLSLRSVAATYEHNKTEMVFGATNMLEKIFKLHYPDEHVYVECSTEDLIDNDSRYTLIINITVSDQQNNKTPLILKKCVAVDTITGEFQLILDPEKSL